MPLVAGGVFAQQKAGKDNVYEELNLFDQAFERIRQDAVDPVTDTKLIGSAIAGMLSGLDPHSSFIDEAAFRAMQTPANDDTTTLGLAVTIEGGQLKVISPEDGSPAACLTLLANWVGPTSRSRTNRIQMSPKNFG